MVKAGSQAKTKIKLMTHVFKHPKFYRIPRDKSDQAISKRQPTGESERASWSGPQASSDKQQAIEESVPYTDIIEATSNKRVRLKPQATKTQAASNKPQAPGRKAQASSHKRQAP